MLTVSSVYSSFAAAATVNTFSAVKKIKSAANWKNFFSISLPAVQFASVNSCARRLLKHFSCRSFCIMRTTNDLGMPVFRDISWTVLWVRTGPLDPEPYRSSGQCFHSRGTSRSVVALTFVYCACVSKLLQHPVNATWRPSFVRKFCPQLSRIISLQLIENFC